MLTLGVVVIDVVGELEAEALERQWRLADQPAAPVAGPAVQRGRLRSSSSSRVRLSRSDLALLPRRVRLAAHAHPAQHRGGLRNRVGGDFPPVIPPQSHRRATVRAV
jgi:hypothetical protein